MRRLGLIALAAGAAVALGSADAAPRVTFAAPAAVTAGLPAQVVVRVQPAQKVPVRVVATSGALRRVFTARAARAGVHRATITLQEPGRWSLAALVGGARRATRAVTAREASAAHPYAVAVVAGTAFVADGATGRVLRLGNRGLAVHASGFTEPTGLAARGGVLYVADYGTGLVRRADARGRVTTLASLPQVASVAVAPDGAVYAVAIDGPLVRISPRGVVTPIAELDRPHGVAVDRDGTLLVAEDSKRVRRVNVATGRIELVATAAGVNRIAVATDGTLYLAGTTLDGGSLRRVAPGGSVSTMFADLHVSDVALLPGGDLLVTAIEPGLVLRVDPRTGARTRVAG